MQDTAADPKVRVWRDAGVKRNFIGLLKTNAQNVIGQLIRVFTDDLIDPVAVLCLDLDRHLIGNIEFAKKHQRFPQVLLFFLLRRDLLRS